MTAANRARESVLSYLKEKDGRIRDGMSAPHCRHCRESRVTLTHLAPSDTALPPCSACAMQSTKLVCIYCAPSTMHTER